MYGIFPYIYHTNQPNVGISYLHTCKYRCSGLLSCWSWDLQCRCPPAYRSPHRHFLTLIASRECGHNFKVMRVLSAKFPLLKEKLRRMRWLGLLDPISHIRSIFWPGDNMEEQVNQANLPPCLTSDSGSHIPHHKMYENSCHVVRSKPIPLLHYGVQYFRIYQKKIYIYIYIYTYRLIIGKSIQNNITHFSLQYSHSVAALCEASSETGGRLPNVPGERKIGSRSRQAPSPDCHSPSWSGGAAAVRGQWMAVKAPQDWLDRLSRLQENRSCWEWGWMVRNWILTVSR